MPQDGLADGIIAEPTQCHFDPAKLKCTGPESDSCLTEPQIAALKKSTQVRRLRAEKRFFRAICREENWGRRLGLVDHRTGTHAEFAICFWTHFFRDMVFEDSNWDFRKFKLDEDAELADTKMAAILNATDPDLRRFRKRGGKLIMYHGWSDAAISPVNSIDYYESVVARMGGESQRLHAGFSWCRDCNIASWGRGRILSGKSRAARKATPITMF